jgi:hypothetical protein
MLESKQKSTIFGTARERNLNPWRRRTELSRHNYQVGRVDDGMEWAGNGAPEGVENTTVGTNTDRLCPLREKSIGGC